MKILSRRTFINSMLSCSLAFPFRSSLANSLSYLKIDASNDRIKSNKLFDEMSILFLGTGAADWDQKHYPNDKNKLLSGMHRGLSSMLINNSVLIDCGPTVPKALDMFEVNVDNITDILITHSHGDHFNVEAINEIQNKRLIDDKIKLWVHKGVSSHFTTLAKDTGCEVNTISSFDDFSINGLDVTAVEANHDREGTGEQCLQYILKSKDKVLFYALDGGWITTKTWNVLKGLKIDAIVWDATWGDEDYFCLFSHNNMPMIRLMIKPFIKEDVFNVDSKIFLSHLGRNYHPAHKIFEKSAASEGMIAAYDGLKADI